MSRTIEDILKQYQPVLNMADFCYVQGLSASNLNNHLEIVLESEIESNRIVRSDAIKLCAHLCAQFFVSFDELEKAMTPLAIKVDAIAEEMGVDITLAGVDDVN